MSDRVAEVDGMFEVVGELVPAAAGATAHDAAKGAAAGITAQEGFREEEEVDRASGGALGDALEQGERLGRGGLGGRGGGAEAYGGHLGPCKWTVTMLLEVQKMGLRR